MADNITNMATLVSTIKRDTRLTESTIIKIVEMTIYMAQNQPQAQPEIPDDFPLDNEGLPIHPTDEKEPEPESPENNAAIEAAAEPEAA